MTDGHLSGNLIGLDYGDKTVGVAFCDKTVSTAVSVETVRRERPAKLRQTLKRIAEICEERRADGIVIGLPLHIDGTEGNRCVKTREFGELVKMRVSLPVVFHDERLTSVAAEEAMTETNLSFDRQKVHVDELAAMLILQDYLNAGYRDS